MDLGSSSTQLISTAFVFGLAALVFSHLPFLFILTHGILRANSGHHAHSSSIMSVFTIAFVVHFLACILFMIGIKLLDVLGALYETNYLQNKVFSIFWARGQSEVFSLASSSGSTEDQGAYLSLYIIQTLTDWLMLGGFWAVFIAAISYATIQTKRDVMQFSIMSFTAWLIIANVVGFFIYILWAHIASLALFIPDGENLVQKIISTYKEIVTK